MTPLTILYVDDDRDIRLIVELSLKLDPAITLREAHSGPAALSALAEEALPDVLLLDVMMPGIDGPTLLDRLREDSRTRDLPVIFLTARARDSDIAGYRARGATGIIVKPFDPLTLAATVRGILTQR